MYVLCRVLLCDDSVECCCVRSLWSVVVYVLCRVLLCQVSVECCGVRSL